MVAVFAQQVHLAVVGKQPDLLVGQAPSSRNQVGTALQGPDDGLGPAPPVDAGMVPGQERLGNGPTPEVAWAGVLRVLEETGRKALVGR